MGFSVSGSFAILVVASFIAFGMAYTSGANGLENVRDAGHDAGEGQLEQQNTAIEIVTADHTLGVSLTIEVDNVGATTLSVNETDVIVNNRYVTHEEVAEDGSSSEDVDGDTTTDLWQPGETYTVELSSTLLTDVLDGGGPNRVKIVTGPGVADASGVS